MRTLLSATIIGLISLTTSAALATPLPPDQQKILFDSMYRGCVQGLNGKPEIEKLKQRTGRDIPHEYCNCSAQASVKQISQEDVMAIAQGGGAIPQTIQDRIKPEAKRCLESIKK